MRNVNIHTLRHIILCFMPCLFLLFAAPKSTINAASTDGWTLYPSYSNITEIEPTGKEVYVLASNSLFSYNPTDGLITTYDKTNLLSDIEATHIAWSKSTGKLIVTYTNSNIDLISRDGKVTNVPDLYMKEATYDKTINNIYLYDKYAYLSTAFGIVKMNVSNGSISDSYQLGFPVDYCYIEGNYIYAASSIQGTYRGNMQDNLLDKSNWSRTGEYVAQNVDRTKVYDQSANLWWTKNDEGKLTCYKLDEYNQPVYITEGVAPDGPASNNFYRIYLNNGSLYGVGGLWSQETDGNRPGEIHVWNGDSWSEFEKVTYDEIGHNYVDVLCLDFDPTTSGHVMAGAKSGMYEFQNGKFIKHYNYDNSELKSAVDPSSKDYTIVTSVKYDAAGNLWALNSHVGNSIKSMSKSDGKWTTYQHSEFSKENSFDLQKLFISKTNGKMWFVNNNYNNTILYSYDYTNDVLTKYGPSIINQDGTNISANYIFSPVEDKDGNVWIGTNVGPVYLSASAIQSGSTYFTQHKVPRNDGTNYADYLLSGIDVRAIAIDGGNRKWIGTNANGVFLISDDNNTQVSHFTTDNSPLPSNLIQDIAIDGTTGRVYFATDKGLCSYMSDATEPADEMTKDNVYAYPNPVRPDYSGPITITGLTYDADVKIVTANGVLVNKGTSTGGSYTWDGCDLNGKRVASGVYMVQTATSTGDKGTVCKIAIVN
ncbi:two-component regulator propeller domain-containing protein [uncultured Prevotella sp.]|uniref:type IX secretion system anionic LPS delivery protein PorZ n=1 Tax=uncultured Prevotella sp. TaxID=159272 RepID=UPI002633D76A|nr:two-component regulator propeller domain-containing protein [uncultured Prevotella sp.]